MVNRQHLSSPLLIITTYSLITALALILHPISALTTTTINMVEGHSVHRIASRFRSKLVGRKFAASSPNGRFVDGASAIDGRVLSRMEAVGKNLFAFFSSDDAMVSSGSNGGEEEDVVVVHVHFGMSGVWAVYNSLVEEVPEVKPTTRLRLEEITTPNGTSSISTNDQFITHLSAMTVAHGTHSLFYTKKSALGQDPLRSDANPNLLYTKIAKSKMSIGKLLMDQSYFAGPGNIFRAEILFLAGVYPTTLGTSLDRASFDKIWNVSVSLLRRGYDTGSILTVDATVDPTVAARGERRYIYNKSVCARCAGRVSSWDMAGRTCYACEGGACQPKSTMLSYDGTTDKKVVKKEKEEVQKKVVLATAKGKKKSTKQQQPQQHVPFISHCAPMKLSQRLEQGGAERLTIAEIRSVLEQISPNDASLPPKSARKAVQVEALNNLLLGQQQHQPKRGTVVKEEETSTSYEPLPPPVVSAEDAAREKSTSGENRAVEHVAELSREQAVKAISVTPEAIAAVGDSKPKPKNKKAKKEKSDGLPEVGMRVSVRFDKSKMYGGAITKVKPMKKQKKDKKAVCNITIKYDDGTSEVTAFPDPDIVLARQGCPPKLETISEEEEEATMSCEPLPPPMVSPEDAAREKAVSGENRAVEHVAELSREQAVKALSVTPSPAAAVEEPKPKRNTKKVNNKRVGTTVKSEEDCNRIPRRRRLEYKSKISSDAP